MESMLVLPSRVGPTLHDESNLQIVLVISIYIWVPMS